MLELVFESSVETVNAVSEVPGNNAAGQCSNVRDPAQLVSELSDHKPNDIDRNINMKVKDL